MEMAKLDVRSYLFASKDEAWDMIVTLQDILERDSNCTVADFKYIMGVGVSYLDTIWGWTDLRDATAEKGEYGWYLVLPEIELLEV